MRRLAWPAGVLLAFGLLVPTPARATFPGPNGRIAFSTDFSNPSQIFTMRPDGTDLRQLTHLLAGHAAVAPSWSPTGTRIAFTVSRVDPDNPENTLSSDIWVMNRNGTGKARLTHGDGFQDRNPSWSPDGTKIVFSRCVVLFGNEICDIEQMNADGTAITRLLGGNWKNRNPEYSPGGRKIAFDSTRGGLVSAVWVMNANGSAPKRLTDPVLQAGAPHWSPDGGHILFTTNTELPGNDVWVMDAGGGAQHALTNLPLEHSAFGGRYSPDERHIVVVTDLLATDDVCCDAFLMNPDGTNLHVIAHRHPNIVSVDWGARPAP